MKYYDTHKARKPYLTEKEPYEGMAISYILANLIREEQEQRHKQHR